MSAEPQRICLVSGGTGGHLMPALVLARAMQDAGCEPLLVTEGRDVERELLRRELPGLACRELPRSRPAAWSLPLWLARATWTARRLLRREGIAGVVSTGGRASVPVALAARSLRLPLFLLEQNAVTGRSNRWLQPLARRVYLGLPSAHAPHPRAVELGTPLRSGFGRIDRKQARHTLGLTTDAPVVLVTGGSQGARVLNEVVPPALARLGRDLQVVHLCGLRNEAAVRQLYAAADRVVAHVRPVAADMDRLFAAADLVICRGGGTTVAELMACGRAAVIVPYPHHKDRQQWHNARVLERRAAAHIVEQRDFDAAALVELAGPLLQQPEQLRLMGERAAQLARPDAAADILADMQRVLNGRDVVAGPQPEAIAEVDVDRPAARRGGVA